MTAQDNSDVPIYHSLVVEQGDVLAEARHAAEEAQHSTHQALDGNGLSPGQQGEAAWSVPGQGVSGEVPHPPPPRAAQPLTPQQPGQSALHQHPPEQAVERPRPSPYDPPMPQR